MTIEELKNAIEQRTGIPASLLQGTEPKDVIAYAKDLANFAKPAAPAAPIGGVGQEKSAREIFNDWWTNGDPEPGTEVIRALNQIEADFISLYPSVPDAGEQKDTFTPSLRDQFAEWAREALAYNPFDL